MTDPVISFVPYAPGTTDSQGQRIASIDPRLSRTNYFDGRLLKASDLIRDQVYLDERALEIGQVLGSGLVRGLDLTLRDNYRLQVSPGLAIAPSGRVLQLSGQTLEVNLGNTALITSLNQGYYRRFRRGLYLVALQYAEVGSDSAEAYPADLASRRSFNFNSFAEGVELTLVPLNVPLSPTTEVAARAGLVGEFIGRGGQRPELSDEAVALGLLALEQGRPLWLDRGLVRRPLRQPGTPGALQRDLAAHYAELLDLVIDSRNAGGLGGGFPAAQYFATLPPWGPLPKAAIDPINGSQTFFPPGYEVSVAPVRRDDLPAILEESARLAPLDLRHAAADPNSDADIMVLAPLSNSEFAFRARALERGLAVPKDKFGLGRLLAIDGLALRLRPQPAPHKVDTDQEAWRAIWQLIADDELIYVRRPPRTAETNVSAVVLARGFDLPKPTPDLSAYNRVMERQLADTRDLLDTATQDLHNDRKNFALRLRNLKLDPAAPARELSDRVKALEQERNQLAAKVKDLEAGATDSAELAAARAEVTEIADQLAAARAQIAELQTAGSNTLSNHFTALQKENQVLQTNLNTANKNLAALGTTLTDRTNKLEAAQTQLKEVEAARAAAEGTIKELQAARTAAESVARAEVKAEMDKLNAQLTAANTRITDLRSEAEKRTRSSLEEFAKLRPPVDEAGKRAIDQLRATLADREAESGVVRDLLLLVDRRYDEALWPNLAQAAKEPGRLATWRDSLLKEVTADTPLGPVMLKFGKEFGLEERQLAVWEKIG